MCMRPMPPLESSCAVLILSTTALHFEEKNPTYLPLVLLVDSLARVRRHVLQHLQQRLTLQYAVGGELGHLCDAV